MQKGQRLGRGVMQGKFGRLAPWLAVGLVATVALIAIMTNRGERAQEAEAKLPMIQEVAHQDSVLAEEARLAEEAVEALTWLEGNMAGNQSFFNKLIALGISGSEVHRLVQLLKPVYNFRRALPGHTWRLGMVEGSLVQFILEVSPVEIYEIMDFQTEP